MVPICLICMHGDGGILLLYFFLHIGNGIRGVLEDYFINHKQMIVSEFFVYVFRFFSLVNDGVLLFWQGTYDDLYQD